MAPSHPSPEPRRVPADGEQCLAFDDVGDPGGVPVLYCHGIPDSRRSRHPDDGLAVAAGVRLLAVDRPGVGGSDPYPGATPVSVADDLVAVADVLGVARMGIVAWSAGALIALTLAARYPNRIGAMALATTLAPSEAADDPAVAEAAPEAWLAGVELAREEGPTIAAEHLTPMLAPVPCDPPLAAEVVAETSASDRVREAELASVPGAGPALAHGIVDATAQGEAALAGELRLQLAPCGIDPARVICPVTLLCGDADPVAPPAFSRWWAERLPQAELRVIPGASHTLVFTYWSDLLAAARGG